MDFTVKKYESLLKAMIAAGYDFQTFQEFLISPKQRSIVLRHDVDLLPQNSLHFARIQASIGIKGVYYFRAVPESWDERIILEIAEMGHEIGYHYENLTTCNGDLERGFQDFKSNLIALRKLTPVCTICMHGSPMSKFDSKDLWKKYRYQDLGLIGEPYFDVDFSKVFYLTDTGRRWDGDKVSVRDRVNVAQDKSYHATNDLIDAFSKHELPSQIMFTFHPQRWNDDLLKWTKELVMQNIKNVVKQVFYVKS
jgi:hypothetical protein